MDTIKRAAQTPLVPRFAATAGVIGSLMTLDSVRIGLDTLIVNIRREAATYAKSTL
ncbi:MAG: hypothetical protein ACOVOX_17740 [Burkholderiaceae bacterium]